MMMRKRIVSLNPIINWDNGSASPVKRSSYVTMSWGEWVIVLGIQDV